MERWEYKTLQVKSGGFLGGKLDGDEFETLLNAYGSEGWELVSVFDTSQSQGASRMIVAVFKRRK